MLRLLSGLPLLLLLLPLLLLGGLFLLLGGLLLLLALLLFLALLLLGLLLFLLLLGLVLGRQPTPTPERQPGHRRNHDHATQIHESHGSSRPRKRPRSSGDPLQEGM